MLRCEVALLLFPCGRVCGGNNSMCLVFSHSCQHEVADKLIWIREEFLTRFLCVR